MGEMWAVMMKLYELNNLNYKSNQMITIYLFLSLLVLSLCDMIKMKEWAAGQAHTDQINAIAFYNDNSKFVTGSKDWKVKIWSMDTYQLLHEYTCTEVVTYINIHPTNNKIFILVWDGAIVVLDPNTYTVLNPGGTYQTGYGANSLQFFSDNTKFIAGGYDSATANPAYHIYNANTYAWIRRGAETTHGLNQQITVMSVDRNAELVASISSAGVAPITLQIYNINTDTVRKVFSDNAALLKWVTFSPFKDELYANCNDMTLQIYRINPFNAKYSIYQSISTSSYGYPNGMSAKLENQLVYSSNNNIVFLNLSAPYPQVLFSRTDQADIFAFQISSDGKYLVSGMRNGQVSVWKIGQPETPKDQNYTLLIALAASIGGLLLLIISAVVVYKCCCQSAAVKNEDQPKHFTQQKEKHHNRTENNIVANQNGELDASVGFH